MTRSSLLHLTILAFSLFTNSLATAAKPDYKLGDYDGDGLQDVAVALVDKESSTTAWLAMNPISRQIANFTTFTTPADALVAGRFFPQDKRTFPGVVYVRDGSLPLEWNLSGPEGFRITIPYGLPGDNIPNLGDLDCDGITDLAIVRTQEGGELDGYNIWYMRLSSIGFQYVAELFGEKGDKMMTSDVDGDGCSEFVALRSDFFWYTKKPFEPQVTALQWGADGDYPIVPTDLDGDGLTDYTVVRGTGGAGQVAFVRYGNGDIKVIRLGPDDSLPIIADFIEGSEFAWHDRSKGIFTILKNSGKQVSFPFGIPQNAFARPDGTVIQPRETGRFSKNPIAPVEVPSLPGEEESSSESEDTPGCTRTGGPTNFSDGANGLLWKPVSEGVSNGAPALLFPKSTLGAKLSVLGNDGSVVSGTQRANHCCYNGGRNHFWLSKTARQLQPYAPLTVKLVMSTETWCLGVADPTKRID